MADLATGVNLLRAELDLSPLDLPTVRRNIGDGATMLMTRSLPEGWFSQERLERFLALYRENLLVHTVVYPGIREFLEAHRHRPMAVVTNKPFVFARDLLDGLDLLHYFPVVLGGESCPAKKPDPAPVLCALDALGVSKEGAVMIGDHHTDLKSGRAAGIRTCFCAWGIGEDGGIPHDYRAENPRDLLTLFPS